MVTLFFFNDQIPCPSLHNFQMYYFHSDSNVSPAIRNRCVTKKINKKEQTITAKKTHLPENVSTSKMFSEWRRFRRRSPGPKNPNMNDTVIYN